MLSDKTIALLLILAVAVFGFAGYKHMAARKAKLAIQSVEQPPSTEPSPAATMAVAAKVIPTPLTAATPQAVLGQKETCLKPKELFIVLNDSELVALHRSTESLQISEDRVNQLCLQTGDVVTLLTKAPSGPEPFDYRGYARVKAISPKQGAQIEIAYRILERSIKYAPLCLERCDQVIEKIPSENGERTYVFVDARYNKTDSVWWRKAAEPDSSSRAVNDDQVAKFVADKKKDFTGATLVVMSPNPRKTFNRIFDLMRELKSTSPGKILWLYTGRLGQDFKSLEPAPIEGVRIIHSVDLSPLLGAGSKLVYAKNPKTPSKMQPLPDSILISNKTRDASKLNSATTYIVYGNSRDDWMPYRFLRKLKLLGFTQLYWLQGGLAEYHEAKRLGIVK